MQIPQKIKNFFNKTKKKEQFGLIDLTKVFGIRGLDTDNIGNSADYAETIYFVCLKHLSETMSKMPWEKNKLHKKKTGESV